MEMSEQVLKQLQWRYATKKFDPTKKIPDDLWQVLEQSLVLAPSSFGLQPWKFIEVRNPDVRQKLLEHSWKQTQVVDASHLVVFAIKKNIDAAEVDRYLERMSEVQGTPVDALQGFGNVVKGFLTKPPYPLNLDEWSARQLYIALGQFMTCAAMLNIDTCPMEGLNPAKYDEILGLTDYATVVACPAGYRAEDDRSTPANRPKVRYKLEDVIQYID
ncbi:NAD(P)H-dependent oxidoreductase [Aphanothece hegewaldii CCALA 016]|uniref:NAD(P)H-dependent oxidoreductase n=2 Tax=Aphanothece TaxID=1121 RepID=A0A2T1M0B0_9CHRO|nr:NAD(P)H-dependent oxidoreductase [Aphanothece hegewaldii CCALA 016]